jgi:hypothetical protein
VLRTVTDVVYTVVGEQPASPVPLVTVSEYTEVTVGVAVGLASVVEESAGPLHEYTLAPPEPFDVNVTVPPTQIGPLLVGAAIGVLLTVTEVVYTVVGAQPGWVDPSLTVSEYTEVAEGVAVGFSTDVLDNAEPLHTNVLAPSEPLPVRFTVPPSHIGLLFVGAAIGVLFTVTDVV